ncbi:preprotein translocase SecY [Synechococcus sp. WH 7805]|nr:preprotein translocase SecY [Synechococcus sp. WH 7805]
MGWMQESRPRIEILRTAQTLELGVTALKGLTPEVRRFHQRLRFWCELMP